MPCVELEGGPPALTLSAPFAVFPVVFPPLEYTVVFWLVADLKLGGSEATAPR